MRIGGLRQSSNVEDRRGMGGPGMLIGGGGLGTVAIVLIAMFLGVDPGEIINATGGGQPAQVQPSGERGPRPDDELATFSRQVLGSTEDVFGKLLGPRYQPPVLVLYDGATEAGACGVGQAAMGPFYCPADQKVYIDLTFYETLKSRMGAPGDLDRKSVV